MRFVMSSIFDWAASNGGRHDDDDTLPIFMIGCKKPLPYHQEGAGSTDSDSIRCPAIDAKAILYIEVVPDLDFVRFFCTAQQQSVRQGEAALGHDVHGQLAGLHEVWSILYVGSGTNLFFKNSS
ncbi:unnamed protein product [Protopolystoma xenopodis]|uniref:Uncharacterized protein n=1 Tax=Protopolystoma xenopodis TaxID=117903 RepID=A0A3S5BCT4_9PLAT|nr:unnamed protein product [Protopolystoma xenopodis]